MNSKRGLSRAISALLAASSIFGRGVSSNENKCVKRNILLGKNKRSIKSENTKVTPADKLPIFNWLVEHPNASLIIGLTVFLGAFVFVYSGRPEQPKAKKKKGIEDTETYFSIRNFEFFDGNFKNDHLMFENTSVNVKKKLTSFSDGIEKRKFDYVKFVTSDEIEIYVYKLVYLKGGFFIMDKCLDDNMCLQAEFLGCSIGDSDNLVYVKYDTKDPLRSYAKAISHIVFLTKVAKCAGLSKLDNTYFLGKYSFLTCKHYQDNDLLDYFNESYNQSNKYDFNGWFSECNKLESKLYDFLKNWEANNV